MKEHRKFVRLSAPIGIIYKAPKKSRGVKETASLVRNISGGGVRFLVKEEFRAGELLEVQIQIPHLAEPIEAVGEVVWCTSDGSRDSYETAIRFRDIRPQDLKGILEYVYTIGIG